MSISRRFDPDYLRAQILVSPILAGWYSAALAEPRLLDLERFVREISCDGDNPGFWPRYESWKTRLAALVGWDCQRPELADSQTFDHCRDYLEAVYEGRLPE